VDDLLDVSRITRGKLELKKEVLEIRTVIEQALDMAAPLIDQRGHRVYIDVPARGLSVLGDCVRLAQVVSNLLTNAAKYTEPGGDIGVSASAEADRVVIRVRDNGIGLAPEMTERIFESFVQEAQLLDRSHGGLGLGLNIVRSLTALHGGEVKAKSAGQGHGSEFIVSLPRLEQQEEAELDDEPPVRARPAGALLRVLIVDDNVDAAEMLAEVLAELGHEIEVCHDGASALSIAERFRPELALVDIGLPVMDGYELASALRRAPWSADLKLVAVTGYGQERDRARAREAGFDEHFVKPLDLDKVRELLDRWRPGSPH
jgi:CheY-like chemotaxis protein